MLWDTGSGPIVREAWQELAEFSRTAMPRTSSSSGNGWSSRSTRRLRKKVLEVLYMFDPVDEYAVQRPQGIRRYKKLKSMTKKVLDICCEI